MLCTNIAHKSKSHLSANLINSLIYQLNFCNAF